MTKLSVKTRTERVTLGWVAKHANTGMLYGVDVSQVCGQPTAIATKPKRAR